jgi:hypothetical protein
LEWAFKFKSKLLNPKYPHGPPAHATRAHLPSLFFPRAREPAHVSRPSPYREAFRSLPLPSPGAADGRDPPVSFPLPLARALSWLASLRPASPPLPRRDRSRNRPLPFLLSPPAAATARARSPFPPRLYAFPPPPHEEKREERRRRRRAARGGARGRLHRRRTGASPSRRPERLHRHCGSSCTATTRRPRPATAPALSPSAPPVRTTAAALFLPRCCRPSR